MTKIPKIFSPTVKVLSTDDEKTIFRVVGIPYGGPEYLGGKDLHGEYFDRKNTDFGKADDGSYPVSTIFAYYDHALNERVGKKNLGFARFYQDSDEGQLWDIEVRRAYRYHDMLLALAEKNLLGSSSQPVQTSVEIDSSSGLIKQWHPAEISLTTTPANPDAIAQVLKSFNIDAKEFEAIEEEEEELPTLEEIIGDVEAEVSDIIEGDEEETVESAVEGVDSKAILDAIAQLSSELAEVKTASADLTQKVTDENRVLATGIANVNSALKSFAKDVAEGLKVKVREIATEESNRSEVEREVDEDANRSRAAIKSGIPAGAPGKTK